MTNVVSVARATATGTPTPAPHTPGPDDDFRINFPTANATWSDLILLPTQAFILDPGFPGSNTQYSLYAALGTATGVPVPNVASTNAFPAGGAVVNAVYRIDNPTYNDPIWFVGNGIFDPVTYSELNIDSQSSDFPSPYTQVRFTSGNIKLAGVVNGGGLNATTVYAAIAHTPSEILNPPFFNNSPLDGNIYQILKSVNGGQAWSTTVTPPINYLGTQGYYASSIAANLNPQTGVITLYVAGEQAQANPVNPNAAPTYKNQVLTGTDSDGREP